MATYVISTNIIMNKDVIITFDYEVYLGRQTGTIENCVIKPTELILEILKINNAKAIFFVDATWLLFLKKNFPEDIQAVSDQLKDIINAGSSVELHLHPQWIHAYRLGDEIGFKSFESYRLHSLNQENITDLFSKSIELLERITLQKVSCFRAGGFCIDPFVPLKSAFESFELKYDFSVATGMRLIEGKEYDYDFSDTPNLTHYSFQFNIHIHDPLGKFVEIPLSTYNNNPIYRLANKTLLTIISDKVFGDGTGIQERSFYFLNSLKRRFQFSKSILTIDKTFNVFFKYLLMVHFRKYKFLVIISHPKMISKQALANLAYITKKCNTLNSKDLDNYLSRNNSLI